MRGFKAAGYKAGGLWEESATLQLLADQNLGPIPEDLASELRGLREEFEKIRQVLETFVK